MAEVTVIVGKKDLANYMGYLFIKSANGELKDKVTILARANNTNKAVKLADWIARTFNFKLPDWITPSDPQNKTPATIKITLTISKRA